MTPFPDFTFFEIVNSCELKSPRSLYRLTNAVKKKKLLRQWHTLKFPVSLIHTGLQPGESGAVVCGLTVLTVFKKKPLKRLIKLSNQFTALKRGENEISRL